MPHTMSIVEKFADKKVWKGDEFWLFYRNPPGWTLSSSPVDGHKKEKTSMKFHACCKKDGSEKMPLMEIGNSKIPRAFKKKNGQELGFDYHDNKKAWMAMILVHCWLIFSISTLVGP